MIGPRRKRICTHRYVQTHSHYAVCAKACGAELRLDDNGVPIGLEQPEIDRSFVSELHRTWMVVSPQFGLLAAALTSIVLVGRS